MQRRLVALILTSSIALLGACDSGGSGANPTSGPTSSSPTPSGTGGSEPVPALRLKGHSGTGSYCVKSGSRPEDHLWSGTWLAAHEDATITGVAPVTSGNLDIVGSWVVEDDRGDGVFAPWSLASRSIRGHLVPLRGARLTDDAAYRVVLRLRPVDRRSSEVRGFVVRFRSDTGGGMVSDDSTLRVAQDC